MKDTIYIRADANESIGMGHIMRCLSIANKVRSANVKVVFIVADETSAFVVNEKGYETICLHSKWDDLEAELELLSEVIRENKIQCLLIDHYYVTDVFLQRINDLTKVYYMDDIDAFLYPVSHVINYNIYANDLNYKERYAKEGLNTKFLLGTDYVPLRSEFEDLPTRKFHGLKKILISSGGTDQYNMIGTLLDYLAEKDNFSSYEFYCVIGRFNSNKDSLMQKYKSSENINLLYNISNMSDYMRACDLCIAAGGTTVYELCASGIPSILYTLADNQLDCAHKVSEIKLIPWVGDIRNDLSLCLERIAIEIEQFHKSTYWEEVSKSMQSYVDGKGARRIANELLKYVR